MTSLQLGQLLFVMAFVTSLLFTVTHLAAWHLYQKWKWWHAYRRDLLRLYLAGQYWRGRDCGMYIVSDVSVETERRYVVDEHYGVSIVRAERNLRQMRELIRAHRMHLHHTRQTLA
jgi:predicted cupin superfamily sugar epimerase